MVRYTRPGAGVRASSCAAELRNSSPAAAPDLASSYSVAGAGAGGRPHLSSSVSLGCTPYMLASPSGGWSRAYRPQLRQPWSCRKLS